MRGKSTTDRSAKRGIQGNPVYSIDLHTLRVHRTQNYTCTGERLRNLFWVEKGEKAVLSADGVVISSGYFITVLQIIAKQRCRYVFAR